nr:MAG: hypothetical protein DIU57_17535 [Pseudomonadota bacterium]
MSYACSQPTFQRTADMNRVIGTVAGIVLFIAWVSMVAPMHVIESAIGVVGAVAFGCWVSFSLARRTR